MLCGQCESLLERVAGNAARQVPSANGRGRVSTLLCGRCGSLLPSADPDAGMLAKLSQLSRFGLGADDRPLLAAVKGD